MEMRRPRRVPGHSRRGRRGSIHSKATRWGQRVPPRDCADEGLEGLLVDLVALVGNHARCNVVGGASKPPCSSRADPIRFVIH